MEKMFLIGEVSGKVGLSQKRIREYEKEGFIAPIRDPNTNNRHYTDLDIQQIKQINNPGNIPAANNPAIETPIIDP